MPRLLATPIAARDTARCLVERLHTGGPAQQTHTHHPMSTAALPRCRRGRSCKARAATNVPQLTCQLVCIAPDLLHPLPDDRRRAIPGPPGLAVRRRQHRTERTVIHPLQRDLLGTCKRKESSSFGNSFHAEIVVHLMWVAALWRWQRHACAIKSFKFDLNLMCGDHLSHRHSRRLADTEHVHDWTHSSLPYCTECSVSPSRCAHSTGVIPSPHTSGRPHTCKISRCPRV